MRKALCRSLGDENMPRLFTYTIPIDDGAAPNPFDGMCSLAICKPSIRRVAKEGDWVAGLGSVRAPGGNRYGQLVYAMRVDEVISMEEYDRFALERWPYRIPNIDSTNVKERLGDCIYNFSSGMPEQRRGVHDGGNQKTDLGGLKVLLSWHFYYFGNKAMPLPENLVGICHQGQGHKSNANAPFFQSFVDWIEERKWIPTHLYGQPDFQFDWSDNDQRCISCRIREKDGQSDLDLVPVC